MPVPQHRAFHRSQASSATMLVWLATAAYQPLAATPPITYVWQFGDGQTLTVTTPSVQHVYTAVRQKTVQVTISNACTPVGVSVQRLVPLGPVRVYLPLVMRAW